MATLPGAHVEDGVVHLPVWEVVRTDAGPHLRLRAGNGEIVLTSEVYADPLSATVAMQLALSTRAIRSVDERSGGGGRAADNSEPDRVSPAPEGEAGSRERLDPLAATPTDASPP